MEYEEKILDCVKYYLKKEMFEYDEEKGVFIKNKDFHSAIGLQENTNEIFIRWDCLSNLINKSVREVIDCQLKDLKRVREKLSE